MNINKRVSCIILGLVCLMVSAWGIYEFFSQRTVADEQMDYNKERAVHMVIKYHEMVQDSRIYEAFEMIPVFYKDEFSEIMASVKSSWSNPSPFEIKILEVNKINDKLYQVIVRTTHILDDEDYDDIQDVGECVCSIYRR